MAQQTDAPDATDDSNDKQEMAVFAQSHRSGDLVLLLRVMASTVDEAVRNAVESEESSAPPDLVDGEEFVVMHDLTEPMVFATYDAD